MSAGKVTQLVRNISKIFGNSTSNKTLSERNRKKRLSFLTFKHWSVIFYKLDRGRLVVHKSIGNFRIKTICSIDKLSFDNLPANFAYSQRLDVYEVTVLVIGFFLGWFFFWLNTMVEFFGKSKSRILYAAGSILKNHWNKDFDFCLIGLF